MNAIEYALSAVEDLKLRSRFEPGVGYHLSASNGEKRFIFAGNANTVLANHGWPKAPRVKLAVLWQNS
jgi:hypothetical protein